MVKKNSGQIILVTGAASSGKSEWAENLAFQQTKPVVYIATAQSDSQDQEWCLKIAKHRQRRPSSWQIKEIPTQLNQAINSSSPQTCLLIDSLGTWVANLLNQNDADWQFTVQELLQTIDTRKTDLILVAEETAWGVVPAYESGRLFRNRLGNLIRQIGSISDAVYLVTGGYAIDLTLLGEKIPSVQLRN